LFSKISDFDFGLDSSQHPSGDPMPSPEDMELTRRLAAAGVLMGIDVIDHVVLGDVRYWSFKEAVRL
jgi:DNA repair protein RadC